MPFINILPFLLAASSLLYITTFGHPAKPHPATLPLPSHVLYQFPDPTWLENIYPRSNGHLLFTLLSSPSLYHFDPYSRAPPVLVHSFAPYHGLLGIAEPTPDLFYVIAGNFSVATSDMATGTYAVFEVDLRDSHHSSVPKVSKVVDLPKATFLNALEPISPTVLLISDSGLGVVWRLDLVTKKYSIVLDYPEMKPHPGNGSLLLGINGIKTRDNNVYFIDSQAYTFNRIAITPSGHAIKDAKVEILTTGVFGDDFTFGPGRSLNAWICENLWNRISVIDGGQGKSIIVLGETDALTVPGPTAARFGRGKLDKEILYVVTTGGLAAPINGTLTEGGKILAIDTSGWK